MSIESVPRVDAQVKEVPAGEQIAAGVWAAEAWEPEAETTVGQAYGLTLSRDRALQVLDDHDHEGLDVFFDEVGDRDHYAASDVVEWLGY